MRDGMAEKRRRAVMVLGSATLITVASLLRISPYGTDFMISLGGVVLPVLAFLIRRLPVLFTAVLGGLGVIAVRTAGFLLEGAFLGAAFASAWPEFVFYCAFGLLLWGYVRFVRLQPFCLLTVLPLMLMDVASNVAELCVRIGPDTFDPGRLLQLAAAAACRTVMAALTMWVLERYGLLVMRSQDALRYRRLLLMTSMLVSELFWLDKSSSSIEDTMTAAYGLYQSLSESEAGKPYAARAMQIATDIHEVKKEYLLITRGIGEALRTTTQKDSMAFSEICDTLRESLTRGGAAVQLDVRVERDFVTRRHYALMSVLHNLLSNAVEAAGDNTARVQLTQRQQGENFVIIVTDSSGGIDEGYLEQIFLPGFSSKMDGATGELNRGLGLCIVKELCEEKFGGQIGVQTGGGGTAFTLTLPARALEDNG